MPNQQPIVTDTRGRRFACSAAGVLAFIVNDEGKFLLLSSPKRPNQWEVVNGALNSDETLLDAVLREIREEIGAAARVRPRGVVHAYTFRYDDVVQYMISVAFLLSFEGGEIVPSDDMTGSAARWFTVHELESGAVDVIVPAKPVWLFRHALSLYYLLKDQPQVELQPFYDATTKNKYGG
jgi:8-oxo-dGTP pyrophosphatase MutT (NUDIX family)